MATSGTNTGHGHVYPRPDGVIVRCGGPRVCKECGVDAAQAANGDVSDLATNLRISLLEAQTKRLTSERDEALAKVDQLSAGIERIAVRQQTIADNLKTIGDPNTSGFIDYLRSIVNDLRFIKRS